MALMPQSRQVITRDGENPAAELARIGADRLMSAPDIGADISSIPQPLGRSGHQTLKSAADQICCSTKAKNHVGASVESCRYELQIVSTGKYSIRTC